MGVTFEREIVRSNAARLTTIACTGTTMAADATQLASSLTNTSPPLFPLRGKTMPEGALNSRHRRALCTC
eukprot:5271095-Pyramimonas_sp.AAC.1